MDTEVKLVIEDNTKDCSIENKINITEHSNIDIDKSEKPETNNIDTSKIETKEINNIEDKKIKRKKKKTVLCDPLKFKPARPKKKLLARNLSCDSEKYEIDKILDDSIDENTGKKIYYIKWKDYKYSENTWEFCHTIKHLQVYKDYIKMKKSK